MPRDMQSAERAGYSHETVRVPHLPVRVDDLLMDVEAIPAATARHVPDRHARTAETKQTNIGVREKS